MNRFWMHGIAIGCALAAAGTSCAPRHDPVEGAFWFENVTFESRRLGGTITAGDLAAIESSARAELARAFAPMQFVVSDRRDAPYGIRVVQKLRDRRFRGEVAVAGESTAVSAVGGHGAVSFFFLASGAVACAPEDADRASIVEAIGRGVGRSAVHEFTHLLLPSTPIHDSTDVRSYEFESAARCEHYFAEMHWSIAAPLLEKRLGPKAARP